MTRVLIESSDDPRLEPYRRLSDASRAGERRWLIAEGSILVKRLLASRFPTESVLVGVRRSAKFSDHVPKDVPLLVVADDLMETIVGFPFHRGVMACARRVPENDLTTLSSGFSERTTWVVCPQIHDQQNLGAIARTATALGADGLLLGPNCCDPFARRVLRVSMGAVLDIPVVRSRDLVADLTRLQRSDGFELIASVLSPVAIDIEECPRPGRTALLLGGEGDGLEAQLVELCDRQVTIPVSASVDSLNVAVAAGILLYHFSGRSNSKAADNMDRREMTTTH